MELFSAILYQVLFKKRAGVFYRVQKATRGSRMVLDQAGTKVGPDQLGSLI